MLTLYHDFFQLFAHLPGAIRALVVLAAIPSFPREVEHFPLCILVLWAFLFCEYSSSFFTGLEGKTRSRASRRMCGSCRSCPTCPHSPSSTCGFALPCLRRCWTKLCITWWKTAGEPERLDSWCALPPPAGNCNLLHKALFSFP